MGKKGYSIRVIPKIINSKGQRDFIPFPTKKQIKTYSKRKK